MPNSDDIILLATKCTVLAFHRETGARLWETPLKSGWTSTDFVSLVADSRRVFAHTKGEMFCLDLLSGQMLWQDGLSGFGYGLASLALPGAGTDATLANAMEMRRRQEESARQQHTHNAHHNPTH